MPYSDYVIDAGTLDEVWRLLCALVARDSRGGRPAQNAGKRGGEQGAEMANDPSVRPLGSSPDELSVADLASSFGDDA